jgi:hypothetical protein
MAKLHDVGKKGNFMQKNRILHHKEYFLQDGNNNANEKLRHLKIWYAPQPNHVDFTMK